MADMKSSEYVDKRGGNKGMKWIHEGKKGDE
jgi:hypothetical protein